MLSSLCIVLRLVLGMPLYVALIMPHLAVENKYEKIQNSASVMFNRFKSASPLYLSKETSPGFW